MCNCAYCIKCESCGHKADEHLAGDSICFICNCQQFTSKAASAFDNLSSLDKANFSSFEDFVNQWYKEEN